jgi:hypothetical protein
MKYHSVLTNACWRGPSRTAQQLASHNRVERLITYIDDELRLDKVNKGISDATGLLAMIK